MKNHQPNKNNFKRIQRIRLVLALDDASHEIIVNYKPSIPFEAFCKPGIKRNDYMELIAVNGPVENMIRNAYPGCPLQMSVEVGFDVGLKEPLMVCIKKTKRLDHLFNYTIKAVTPQHSDMGFARSLTADIQSLCEKAARREQA